MTNKPRFLQETNFDDEMEAFKSDALDNYEKHYGEKKAKEQLKSKYPQWVDAEIHNWTQEAAQKVCWYKFVVWAKPGYERLVIVDRRESNQ